jgi:dienelactone hydrolase
MKKTLLRMSLVAIFFAFSGVSTSEAKIMGKTVEYSVQGLGMKSYLAYDENGNVKDQRPGVLVVPEWWGVNDYVRKRAQMLAELGYVALAVDMYGDGKQALTPDEAGKLSSGVMKNIDVAKARFMAAMDFLKGPPSVDPNRVAATGYCFGGGVVLIMARQGVDLKGVVSFHGSLGAVEPAKTESIKAKILVLTGGDDQFVPADQVEAFKREMKEAGADFQVITYPGAKHSFTNPDADALGKKFNLPISYNAQADKQSWEEMKMFLETNFKK